ncbi:flagellar biosynthesis regulator FlaF [Roseinatronobacter sp.]|uniref:flagellar biosynthesis regulator FlaF n=1 Tax=Roseinatronobacter sp. TaxID=1945755 RepID=UPI0025FF9144|nr:flagellar biosynthesis regulator FlaF [Rhodobaca sp.]
MNAHALAVASYGNPTTALKTARSAEYDVIARITSRLRKAIDSGSVAFPALAEAMTENRRLWTEFAIDLASSDNQLPEGLRAQLLNLAQFTMTHTNAVLEGRASADVLVEINTAIMRGLSGRADIS